MKRINYPNKNSWENLLKRPYGDNESVRERVSKILQAVKSDGDTALKYFNKLLDGFELIDFKVTESELLLAEEGLSRELKTAIRFAKNNITIFHETQIQPQQEIFTIIKLF